MLLLWWGHPLRQGQRPITSLSHQPAQMTAVVFQGQQSLGTDRGFTGGGLGKTRPVFGTRLCRQGGPLSLGLCL